MRQSDLLEHTVPLPRQAPRWRHVLAAICPFVSNNTLNQSINQSVIMKLNLMQPVGDVGHVQTQNSLNLSLKLENKTVPSGAFEHAL